jgi:hypothetical protein
MGIGIVHFNQAWALHAFTGVNTRCADTVLTCYPSALPGPRPQIPHGVNQQYRELDEAKKELINRKSLVCSLGGPRLGVVLHGGPPQDHAPPAGVRRQLHAVRWLAQPAPDNRTSEQ